jgi:aminomethyltransferase
MAPFAGHDMPLQYAQGIKHEHLHTREYASLFDVSHMGQIRISGESAAGLLDRLVPSDIDGLAPYQQRYTVLTNDSGGIRDDLMVTRMPDHLFLIVNAARKEQDLRYLKTALEPAARVELLEDRSLIALQGPLSAPILSEYRPDIDQLKFMQAGTFELDSIYCVINRCGYTGEDGFEISVASEQAEKLARMLLSRQQVEMAGLGARDSLRLEAGLCLYGHDIDETTTPVEADLSWVVAKKYQSRAADDLVPGAEIILSQCAKGTQRIRAGFRLPDRALVREGAELCTGDDSVVGTITSGGYGPTIDAPMAMGYLQSRFAHTGTELSVRIRDKRHTIVVTDLPFVKHRYHR